MEDVRDFSKDCVLLGSSQKLGCHTKYNWKLLEASGTGRIIWADLHI